MWKPELRKLLYSGGNVIRFKVLGNGSLSPLPKSGLTTVSRLNLWFLILKKKKQRKTKNNTANISRPQTQRSLSVSVKFHESDVVAIWEVDRVVFTYS